jgi:hypothetical protein
LAATKAFVNTKEMANGNRALHAHPWAAAGAHHRHKSGPEH